MGDDIVKEDIIYKHIGISLNNSLSLNDNVKEAASKIKGTFLSLVDSGIHDQRFNSIASRRIYKTVVLPKALYGCELRHTLLPKHIDLLEISHKFCIMFMQSLPRRTSTYLAISLLNIKSIEYDIDYRKLIFFGQLCCLPPQHCI